MISIQCATNYMVDAHTNYLASAIGATWFLRGFRGFGLPLLSPYLYEDLEFGWGNTVLACAAFMLGAPAAIYLWIWGHALRGKSKFAAGGE